MKYYCLTLPKRLTKREAVEEIFREQQAYDRKFSNLGFRTLEADNSKTLISKNERQNPSYKRFDEIHAHHR